MIIDGIMDAALDSLRLLPFLFLTYLCMELLEKKTGKALQQKVIKAERSGPCWGALLGIVPQCGFSASAASFYAGRVINAGTLLAIFLSTSDEMLPVLISESMPMTLIIRILIIKVIFAVIFGYAAGFIFSRIFSIKEEDLEVDIHSVCEHEHCDCHDGIFKSALKHTVKIAFFIFVISAAMNLIIEYVGYDKLTGVMTNKPFVGVFIAAIIGLIPNCAASVVLTQMYIGAVISGGALIAGLLVGAGVGLLVLFRLEQDKRKCAALLVLLYIAGAAGGLITDAMMIL